MNLVMHKIVNIRCNCGYIGFELDNGETIYQYDDKWAETEYMQEYYDPVIDINNNLMGFVLSEVIIEVED